MKRRSVLWIDDFGGLLIYLQPRISVGAATGSKQADLELVAAIRPIHVWIERDREGYVWQAVGPCRRGDQKTDRGVWHSNSQLVLLTDVGQEACRLQLTLPDPRLLTARLEWCPPTRTVLHMRAAILVSTALHLGPEPSAHIQLRQLPDVWLFPGEDGWLLRSPEDVIVAGQVRSGEVFMPTSWQIRIAKTHLAMEPAENLM